MWQNLDVYILQRDQHNGPISNVYGRHVAFLLRTLPMQNVRSLPQFGAYTRRYFSDTTNGNIWHHPSGPYEHVKHIMKHNIKLRISEYSRHGQRRRTLFALYVFLIDSLLSRLLTSILLFLNKPHHL